MTINEMIDKFEEATQLAESCSHTQDTEYTKLCREVANFLSWYKNQDLISRDTLIGRVVNYLESDGYCGLDQTLYVIDGVPKAEPKEMEQ